ncbi:hypothetical protein BC830DRAFT_1173464 [Chytriomyces sp. MP71]|nr:hypothetical protein BC830DRAFT_1173464 [Chytriomyces sp. MP71]
MSTFGAILPFLVPIAALLVAPLVLPWRITHTYGLRVAQWISKGKAARHRIYFAETRHARVVPVSHAFTFPVLYVGVEVDASPPEDSVFFARDAAALLSIQTRDFLSESSNAVTLRDKVLAALARSDQEHEKHVGRILLVTAPRVLGLPAFNPLNTYYCFEKESGSLRAVLLEVNNTFGERHVYTLDESNKWASPKHAHLHSSYTIHRNFFVSPFNNRSGIYETHISDITKDKMGVFLIVKEYVAEAAELQRRPDIQNGKDEKTEAHLSKHLVASVEGQSVPLNPLTVLTLLYFHPFTIFLTMPRIMSEAWKLAYKHKLGVYQKPNPQRASRQGKGVTIKDLPPTSFDVFCQSVAIAHFVKQCKLHPGSRICFVQVYCGRSQIVVTQLGAVHLDSTEDKNTVSSCDSDAMDMEIHVTSPALFTRLVVDAENPSRALSATFVSGEWSAQSPAHITRFLRLLSSPRTKVASFEGPADSRNTPTLFFFKVLQWARNRFLLFSGYEFSDAGPASPRSTFPPFSLDGRPPMAVRVPNGNELRMLRGVLELWLGEAVFRAVTRFVLDPSLVIGRIQREYSSPSKVSVTALRDGEGALVGEFGDHVAAGERERYRFAVLRDCVDEARRLQQ